MICRYLIPAVVLACLAVASAARAVDSVRTVSGKVVSGKITEMTPLKVSVVKGALASDVPVNEIDYIAFEGEGGEFNAARKLAKAGNYNGALERLAKLNPADSQREYVSQDLAFYKAISAAQIALGGGGISLADAAKQLNGFYTSYPNNFHHLEAADMLGNLGAALGDFDGAKKFYLELYRSNWNDYQMKALVSVGDVEMMEANRNGGHYKQALAMYQRAAGIGAQGSVADRQRLLATLGMGRCLAETGNVPAGIKMIRGVVDKADPNERELHARAYVALGHCYVKANQPKDAILQFLKVELVYNTHPESLADALESLEKLWESINQRQRAVAARAKLKEYFPRRGR